MPDQSLSTPSALTLSDFQKLVDNLHAIAAHIDDCKWVANALHLSALSTDDSAPDETNWRTKGVSRILFTILRKASDDILALIEVLESRTR